MYSATGERVNIIQRNTLITRSISFQKEQPINKTFDFADILNEDQQIGLHLRLNIKHLCYSNGLTMAGVFRTALKDYGLNIRPNTVMGLGNKGQKFSSPYIRLIEIALQLVIGYHFAPFDLVFKSYYTGKDELPAILPPGQRDTFTNRTKKT
jgi:hypothetical protein